MGDKTVLSDWLDSFDELLENEGEGVAIEVLNSLRQHASEQGLVPPLSSVTPYINSIPSSQEVPFPGDGALEWKIRSLVRWNAMAMVVRANRESAGIGGHISTFASAATLYEVAHNHFFKGRELKPHHDLIFFQGHGAPGVYARAFLEGRISLEKLENFRRELKPGGGLSSYPHPWLMPHFWECPTVSMGLGPIMAIYQARFNRYLMNRGLIPPSEGKVWAFLGDGETDEPETLGAISLAAREKLDNLIFVINCNLQRLDGPVRGNGKIIQELEAGFRGVGWNVIKVIWGSDWDLLLEKDESGLLVKRMGEVVDGQYQKYSTESGEYIRKHFFGVNPELAKLAENLTDSQIKRLRRGGHDPQKVYNAYKAAVEHKGSPTVILAKTIKGYGLGEAGEGKNITHQQKKLNEDELRTFRTRYGIPISDEEVSHTPFYRPPPDSPEILYLQKQREKLGGPVPSRSLEFKPLTLPPAELFDEFMQSTGERKVATTMALVRLLYKLIKSKEIGKQIVPIIPDEARTFGMESFFREIGIYSSRGQLYEPVDRESLMYYRESVDGQLLEEGITEAGGLSSFIAAGTAYATHGVATIPFFIYYSMFGFQRVGDLIWAACDMRCKGFLVGATAGRTTLAGEGLQHQDGNSHILVLPYPNIRAYDPAFAYELAVIVRDGIERMYVNGENIFYYLTVCNELYSMPAKPEGVDEGIIKGLYLFKPSSLPSSKACVQLLGSGTILNQALKAQEILENEFKIETHVWSAPSYKNLYEEARDTERWNVLHPLEEQQIPYVSQCLSARKGVVVAASDYLKALPQTVAPWISQPFLALGTDGFGRSESRESLRDFFEVDYRYIAYGALSLLYREGLLKEDKLKRAAQLFQINPDKPNPALT